MRHLLEFILLAILTLPFALLPRTLSLRAGEGFGRLCYILLKRRRFIVLSNLRAAQEHGVLPEDAPVNELARQSFVNIGRTIAEITRISYGLERRLLDRVRVEGLEHLKAALERGRGAIVVTGHFSNWEMVAMASRGKLNVSSAVARKQKNPYIDRLVLSNRMSMGADVVYKEGAIRQFMGILKEGGSVGLILDEPVSPEAGVPVDFMGYRAGFHKTLHALAKRYSSAVLLFATSYDGAGGYVMSILPELEMTGDEAVDTQSVASVLEGFVRENPTEWLQWFRRWTWARENDPDNDPDNDESEGSR